MGEVPECHVLRSILGRAVPCRERCSTLRIASYFEKRKDSFIPRGCLLAHSMLSIVEAQRVRAVFQIPLHRIFKANEVKGFSAPPSEEIWRAVLSAILVHDLGKLTKDYQERRNVRHHHVSAIIARKALEDVFGEFMSLVLAYAIILHHEAIDWRSMEKSFLTRSYIREVFSPSRSITYDVQDIPLEDFEHAAADIMGELTNMGLLGEADHEVLLTVQNAALSELRRNTRNVLRISDELRVAKLPDKRYQVPSIAVYRLIYLADNRAASARERYWYNILSEVDWNKLDTVSEEIRKRLSGKPYYIGLSSIPPIEST